MGMQQYILRLFSVYFVCQCVAAFSSLAIYLQKKDQQEEEEEEEKAKNLFSHKNKPKGSPEDADNQNAETEPTTTWKSF